MFSDTSDASNAGTTECFVKKKKRAKTLDQATDILLRVDVCIAMLNLLETKLVEEELLVSIF